jgi:hypothetical protein
MKVGFGTMVLMLATTSCYADNTVQGTVVDVLLLDETAQEYGEDAGCAADGAPPVKEHCPNKGEAYYEEK